MENKKERPKAKKINIEEELSKRQSSGSIIDQANKMREATSYLNPSPPNTETDAPNSPSIETTPPKRAKQTREAVKLPQLPKNPKYEDFFEKYGANNVLLQTAVSLDIIQQLDLAVSKYNIKHNTRTTRKILIDNIISSWLVNNPNESK